MKKKEIEKISTAFESQLKKMDIQWKKIESSNINQLRQTWREIFSSNIKKQTGEWVYDDYDWHTFSAGFSSQMLSGKEAIKEYESLITKRIIIIFASKSTTEEDAFGYILELPKKPPYPFLRKFLHEWPRLTDVYLIHENFSWTFVVTHEDDEKEYLFGPYFSRKNTV